MELNPGRHSAKRQSWHRNSFRELYAQLKEENPKASPDRLRKLYREHALEDVEWLDAAIDYAANNTDRALENGKSPRRPSLQERADAAEVAVATVEEIKIKILLLNLEMPNGKRMRYCTGAEMSKFGKAYERIAEKVGSTKMVGSVLDEKQVRGLMS
jgi:hypothetical protein